MNSERYAIFKNGSTWLRADFHLHTNADKEFTYTDDENHFVSNYIAALKAADIRIGVIANHNKFDQASFKALRKKGLKEEIFLLPGIELSVKDGSNGVHTLVVFSDEWFRNQENKDYINSFISVTFAGQSNYENENARSNQDLTETIRELDKFDKDYFILFAHVEADNGLWGGLSGGRITELGKNENFRCRTLGFQKVMTHDVADRPCRIKVQNWLNGWYPAEVEGSDCKTIKNIGQGKFCFLKLGDYTFEAVKYALMDYQNRLAAQPEKHKHSYVRSISFEGGILDGKSLELSPELNSLIGIRGSGKSSVLEAIRYVLDISFEDKTEDAAYKNALVAHTLGSGGEAIITAVDRHGREYKIRRILNDQPDIYVDGTLQPGVSIRETIIHKPIYFGQKDLSSTGEGFEKDLVEKLVKEKLTGIRSRIEEQRQKVADGVISLQKLANVEDKKKEYEAKKQDAEFKLKLYKEHGVEEKLQKQVDFSTDERKCKQIVTSTDEYLHGLEEYISQYEDELRNHSLYKSKQNKNFFDSFFESYKKTIESLDILKKGLELGKVGLSEITAKQKEFAQLAQGLKEEFAEIERKLSEELKDSGAQAIRPDEFLQLKKSADQAKTMLEALEKQQTQQTTIQNELISELTILNDLWHDEFKAIKDELDKVNKSHSSLQIIVEYKANKAALIDIMKNMFRGSRIRENTFSALADVFSDFGGMFKDFEKVKKLVGSSAPIFEEYFTNNLRSLLTWQTPNSFTIKYRDKELKHHSLGQRASALILFVLSQHENDLIIIDQPEDDLDNQTIYQDVIKMIRELKQKTQFVFATHNANFPVLGDSEQIFSCHYADENITTVSGSIDCQDLQKEIVDIMEGGEEAFNRRKEIYQIWKPQKFSK